MATTEQFSLRWNNFHSNLTSGFHELLEASEMVDVTLAVEGHFLQAHKIVLSICSPYFKEMFKVNPCKHPIVILKDVNHENIRHILQFMYMGEVNVLRENLSNFLRTAELLQVKGLTGDDSSETSSRRDDKSESSPENDVDDSELMQFNQLMDSDVELPVHFSTPNRVPTPPPAIIHNVVPTAAVNKRQPKNTNSSHNLSSKRVKTENSSTKSCNKSENSEVYSSSNGEDVDSIERGPLKTELKTMDANEETRNTVRQLLENNFTMSASTEPSPPDQDVLLYSVDQKGHVFCPYCCRKFVNRYNLKVHIRDKHEDNPSNLDCRTCGKVMRNRSCLRVHMYHHRKQQLDNAPLN